MSGSGGSAGLSSSSSWARGMGDLMRDMRGVNLGCPTPSSEVGVPRPLLPLSGTPSMMSQASPVHRLGRERLRMGLGVITWREEVHVIAGAKRHELQTPKHNDSAGVKPAKTIRHLGFLGGKGVTRRRPLPGALTIGVWTRDLDTNRVTSLRAPKPRW